MPDLTLTFQYRINGTLTDVTSAVLSDSTATYGVRRADSGGTVVAAGTAMTHVSTGTYTYTFTEPALGLDYEYVVKATRGGVPSYHAFTKPGATADASTTGTTSITLQVPDTDEPTGIELTGITRLDTNTSVALPTDTAFVYDDDEDTWSISFTEPDYGLYYAWRATATFSDSTESPVTSYLKGNVGVLEGTYWTWDGIKNILGTLNAEIASQLDNGVTAADYARIIADGTIADAYTTRRARLRGLTVPMSGTEADEGYTKDFALVRFVTNLYAAFLLVAHREWFAELGEDARAKAVLSLEGRAMALYDALFGVDPGGIDGQDDPDTTGILELQEGLGPVAKYPCPRITDPIPAGCTCDDVNV